MIETDVGAAASPADAARALRRRAVRELELVAGDDDRGRDRLVHLVVEYRRAARIARAAEAL